MRTRRGRSRIKPRSNQSDARKGNHGNGNYRVGVRGCQPSYVRRRSGRSERRCRNRKRNRGERGPRRKRSRNRCRQHPGSRLRRARLRLGRRRPKRRSVGRRGGAEGRLRREMQLELRGRQQLRLHQLAVSPGCGKRTGGRGRKDERGRPSAHGRRRPPAHQAFRRGERRGRRMDGADQPSDRAHVRAEHPRGCRHDELRRRLRHDVGISGFARRGSRLRRPGRKAPDRRVESRHRRDRPEHRDGRVHALRNLQGGRPRDRRHRRQPRPHPQVSPLVRPGWLVRRRAQRSPRR